MLATKEGSLWTLRIQKGEPVMATIVNFVKEKQINHGDVSGIGQAKDFKIGFLKPDGYHWKALEGAYEVISLLGNVAWDKDNPETPLVHLHVSLGDENGNVLGGHLGEATVSFVLEVFIKELGQTKFLKPVSGV